MEISGRVHGAFFRTRRMSSVFVNCCLIVLSTKRTICEIYRTKSIQHQLTKMTSLHINALWAYLGFKVGNFLFLFIFTSVKILRFASLLYFKKGLNAPPFGYFYHSKTMHRKHFLMTFFYTFKGLMLEVQQYQGHINQTPQ